jgi:tRNA (guanine-N7-)-methyltransferase
MFGDDHPVEVEIGPERGTFLIATAAAGPAHNYLGIERSRSRATRMEAAVRAAGLPNIRVLWADAACVVATCMPRGSVHAFHIYFPDPWWKRRHHRRRLLTPDFAILLTAVLAPGGLIHFATDVEETAALAIDSLASVSSLRREPEPPVRPVRTAFEQKALQRGSRLYAVSFRKVAVGAPEGPRR